MLLPGGTPLPAVPRAQHSLDKIAGTHEPSGYYIFYETDILEESNTEEQVWEDLQVQQVCGKKDRSSR